MVISLVHASAYDFFTDSTSRLRILIQCVMFRVCVGLALDFETVCIERSKI